MKNLEMMKQYIREHNLCGRVRELVEGADMENGGHRPGVRGLLQE